MNKDFVSTFWNKYWNFIVSVLVFGVVLFGLYFRHNNDFTGQSFRDATMSFLVSLLITFIFRLNAYQLNLETNQDIIGKFIQLLSKNSKINDTIKHSFDAHKNENAFHQFFLTEIFEEFNTHLQTLSQGKYSCNAEVELTVTTKILECCSKCLKAVSYQDEEWWTSNNGTLYLDAHDKHIDKKKEKAARIFIIESSKADTFKPIFKKHKELQIETHILYSDKDKIEAKYLIDFVIYDDYMLRRASEVKNTEGGKDALFTTEEIEVRRYNNLFEQLLTIAKTKNNAIPE